ncbi:HNH endonuclease family protein [Actinotalea lenta]|uniref:HNH endonuclease family protein n=1 Tax=Actinotalea lenta TaxID=3064654 RepID=UPI003312F9DC
MESAAPETALAAVGELVVKGRAPKTGYDRDLFGSGWGDTDHNGCDTRNDILARDLTGTTFKAGTHDCVVLTGTLADPYSGKTINFVRGEGTSTAVQIDHVVALSDAWQKGAQQWEATKRVAFANDPMNLLAVDGPLNAQKGDGDTATWLPPNKAFRCQYVARQVGVKATYGVWVTVAERDAMVRVLSTCPNEPLPPGAGAAPSASPTSTPTPETTPAPPPPPAPAPPAPPAPAPEPAPACDPSYPDVCIPPYPPDLNCKDVPYKRFKVVGSDPHGFDRDHDGIGCES